MESVFNQKVALRKELRARLRALEPEVAAVSSAAICAQVEMLPEYKNAKTIFAFAGIDWEIDTKALLLGALAEGKRVAVPLCLKMGVMEARIIKSLDDLVLGAYDIPEPKRDCPLCLPEEIDFAVVPCIACDRTGLRLGQGGGFYDRFLASADFICGAICRDIAIEDEIPTESWDRPVDMVITETAVYRRESGNA